MVQKSGVHQLRLVVEIPLFTRFWNTSQVVQDFSHGGTTNLPPIATTNQALVSAVPPMTTTTNLPLLNIQLYDKLVVWGLVLWFSMGSPKQQSPEIRGRKIPTRILKTTSSGPKNQL